MRTTFNFKFSRLSFKNRYPKQKASLYFFFTTKVCTLISVEGCDFKTKGLLKSNHFEPSIFLADWFWKWKRLETKLHSGKVKDCFLFHCYFIYILCEHIGLWEVCVCVCVLEAKIASSYSYRLSMSLVKRTLLPYLMQLHVDLIR